MNIVFRSLFYISFLSTFVFGQGTNFQSSREDSGVDFVIIKAERVNLRSAPSVSSSVIALLDKDDRLILIDRSYVNGFYRVGDISRLQNGWVHGSFIDAWLTNSKISSTKAIVSNTYVTPKASNPCENQNTFLFSDPGVRIPDNGFDLLRPKKLNTQLYSDSDESSETLASLSPSDQIVLLERVPKNNRFEVLYLKTNTRGWVGCGNIEMFFTQKRKSEIQFNEEYTNANEPPTITIENATERELTLWISEEKSLIPPFTKKSITIARGTYRYVASVPGAYPLMGTKLWQNGSIYSWKFFLSKK